MKSRRQLLKTGLAGSLLLLGAGFLARPEADKADKAETPASSLLFLHGGDSNLLAAITPVMLGLSMDAASRESVVAGVDRAVSGLPMLVQGEVRQLLDLLGNRWGRRYLAGVKAPWATAGNTELASFLENWRQSRFTLLRSGYQALHGLINAAWYASPQSFAALGYDVPPQGKVLQ
ncbi:hypothetical protein [Craterilacuibacter sp.]|uniref:hypothetical protein n=1 Tax=Craterilacuibacter sp. TaxID=2870909 RepID=UPI003F32D8E8